MLEEDIKKETKFANLYVGNNNANILTRLTNTAASIAIGYAIGSSRGALIAGTATALDELLIVSENITKHYFTSFTFNMALCSKFSISILKTLPYHLHILLSSTTSAILAKYSEDILPFDLPVKESINLYQAVNSVFKNDQGDVEAESNNIFLTYYSIKFGTNILNTVNSVYLNLKINIAYSKLVNSLYSLSQVPNQNNLDVFLKSGYQICGLHGLFIIADTINNMVQNNLDQVIIQEINHRLTHKLLHEDNSFKLTQDMTGRNIIRTIHSDFFEVYKGSTIINTYVSNVFVGTYGVKQLYEISPESLFFNLMLNHLTSKIPAYLNCKHKEVIEKLSNLSSAKGRVQSDVIENVQQIMQTGGQKFLETKISIYDMEIANLQADNDFWSNVLSFYQSSKYNIDSSLFLILSGLVIYQGKLSIDERFNFMDYLSNQNEILSISPRFQTQSKNSLVSLERVEKFNQIINKEHKSNISSSFNQDNQLILKDFHIAVNGNNLLSVDKISFEFGKIYAINAPSGSGKSLLLKTILGINSEDIQANGDISYPLDDGIPAKIMMIPQEEYLPLGSSLIEIIYYPQILPRDSLEKEEVINKIKDLLLKINIDNQLSHNIEIGSILNKLEDDQIEWVSMLSGGQKKKIAMISAILNNPKILILDETFAGLDSNSIFNAQQLIKNYLSESMLLVVDHHIDANNHNNFYNYELKFSNRTATLESLPVNALNSLLIEPQDQKIDVCYLKDHVPFDLFNL